MKAAVFYGKHDIRFEDRPTPVPEDGEVLLRVHACGICGTDVHILHGDEGIARTPENTVLGHEFAGEIAAVGPNTQGFSIGQRVCVDPNVLCGKCRFCREGLGHFCEQMVGIGTSVDGGYAEYALVPVSQIYSISDNMTYEQAAMAEPLACAIHGMDLCEMYPGARVAVIGCGLIGQLMIQLARLRGASFIVGIEPVAAKRENALKLGADLVIDPCNEDVSKVLQLQGIDRLSHIIECVGKTETVAEALQLAGKRSTVMLFGLTGPEDQVTMLPFSFFKKELTVKGSFVNPYTTGRAVDLIESGRIDVTMPISECVSLQELPLVLADDERRSKGKIVVVI